MRRAMAEAEVGDDAYGEDPTVRRLEERTAEMLGLPAGLFVPTGTQANQIAIGVQCRPGDEVIVEAESHCVNFETAGIAALWGVQPRLIATERGIFSAEQVRASVRSNQDYHPRSRLVCVENTHNHSGGTVWPLDRFRQVVDAARREHLLVHLDGARLWNAHVASGAKLSEYAGLTDSTAVCFSKGLGAPVGSALCGAVELVREGRRLRRRLGGGMRQAGVLAAAALYALDHNLRRLAEDHAHARRLAQGLSAIPGVQVDLSRVETNMVYAELPFSAQESVQRLSQAGVLVNSEGWRPEMIRFVCHLDVSGEDVDEAIARVRRAVSGR
jgi:threonine aldolase